MSLSTNTTYRLLVEKLGATEATSFVGNEGEVFYDPSVATLKLSDGSTSGGVTIGGGGGGGESYWESTGAGINTSSNVGLGTTNPTVKLQVGSVFDPQVIGFGTVVNVNQYPSTNVLIGDENTGPNLTPKVGGDWKGLNNNFIGAGAGKLTTTGSNNNFFGLYAGENTTTGGYNNFFGCYAGRANTTGFSNIFIGGYATGTSNIGGDNNIFMGYYAGNSNTNGNDNVFLGIAAGKYNTTGNYNVFLGRYCGSYNTTGIRNVAIGFFAGHYNTTGIDNIFMGRYAGYNLNSPTDAFSNIFIGNNAGTVNTSGSRNVYIGNDAGSDNNGGEGNVFLGRDAGNGSDPTDWSIFLGSRTGGFGDYSTRVDHKIIIGVGTDNRAFDAPNPHKSHQLAVGIRTGSLPANYWIVGDENFNVGIGTTNPTKKLHVGGDVKVGVNTSQGVVLTSPDGTEYRLVVANDGTLTTTLV